MLESQEWDAYQFTTYQLVISQPPKSTVFPSSFRGGFETGLGAWRHPEIRLSIEDLHLQRDPATGNATNPWGIRMAGLDVANDHARSSFFCK